MQNRFTGVAGLSLEAKEKMHAVLSEIIEKVTGTQDAKSMRIEKALARKVIETWNPRADKAIKAGVAVAANASPTAKFTKAQMNKVLAACGKAFNGIDKQIQPVATKAIREVYANSKKVFRSKFRKRKKSLYFVSTTHGHAHERVVKSCGNIRKATVSGVSFTLKDEEATKALGRLISGSIGDHFDKTRKPVITESILEGVIEQGMTNEEAAEFLQKELTRRLGGEASLSAVPDSIAALGQNSINAYFEGLVATNMNWAQNFSRVNAMREADITRYQLAVVVDGATSDICLDMVGRTFELKQAVDYMDNVLEAESADEIKNFAPWRDDLSEFGLSRGESLNSPSAQEVLAANGMAMPPYHNHCRTEVEPA